MTSQVPAGTSSIIRSTAALYWRTNDTLRSASTGTIVTAPGWCTMKRSKDSPSGARISACPTVKIQPRNTSTSDTRRNGGRGVWHGDLGHAIEVEQVRLAPLRPVERGRHQFTEQGVGPIRSALELGVSLGADPERVVAQLDELDQAPVG